MLFNYQFQRHALIIESHLRFISTRQQYQHISNSINNDKFSKFRFQIENEFVETNSLKYLNNLFSSFQNLVFVKHVDRNQMNIYWERDLGLNEVKQIRQSLVYVNNHKNFQQLKSHIREDLSKFNRKEIVLIAKMYRILELDKSTSELVKCLDDYCLENVKYFDLNDLDHLSIGYMDDSRFYKASFNHVYQNLMKTEHDFISIKSDYDQFEHEMGLDDARNDHLWLKLNIFRRYSDSFDQDLIKTFLKNTFELSILNLLDNSTQSYNINFFVNLFSSICTKTSPGSVFKQDSNQIREFKELYLNDFMNNFDLVQYKLDLKPAFNFLRFNNQLKIENLMEYLNLKLKSNGELTKIEYFQYLDLFNDLIFRKMGLPKQNREFIYYLQDKYPIEAVLTRFITHKHFLMSLDEDLKRSISINYNKFIEELDPLSLSLLKSSYNVIHNVHYNQNEALKSLHRKLLEFAENQRCLDIISSFAPMLVIASDKSSKEYELELSDLVISKNQLDSSEVKLIIDSITIIMLNTKSFIDNFQLILAKIQQIISTVSIADMLSVFYLFNKHFSVILETNKNDTLDLCEILYRKLVNDLNNGIQLNKIETRNAIKLFLKTLRQAKTNYYKGIISFQDYSRLFEETKKIKLNNIDEKMFEINFNERKFMSLHERVAYFSDLISYSRYYLTQNLDSIFSYLCKYIKYDLENNISTEDSVLDSFLLTMRVFKVFDYKNPARINEFRDLNGRFYAKYRHSFRQYEPRILGYASTLINLNCHVDLLFNDIEATYLSYLSTPKLFEKSEFLFSIILYLAVNNPTTKHYLKYKIESVFKTPNKKFFNDFYDFLMVNYENRFTLNYVQESRGVFKLKIDEINQLVQVILIDKARCYDNSNEIVRYLDYNLNCLQKLNIPLIVIKENEFYSKNSLLKQKIINLVNYNNK